jgi:hypothetical protein
VTLILALSNSWVSIQVADGRLTGFNRVLDGEDVEIDDAVKSGAFLCGDARLAYGFTGLAFTGPSEARTFDTRSWLRGALLGAAESGYQIEGIIDRLSAMATATFQSEPGILSTSPANRRLSVMLSGFWNTTAGCLPAGWIITNFQNNFDLGTGEPDSTVGRPTFSVWRWHQSVSPTQEYAHVERLGAWRGVTAARLASLHELLTSGAPVHAIVGMGIATLREASGYLGTAGARVGREASIVIIHKDPTVPIEFGSDVASVRREVANPDIVTAIDAKKRGWVTLALEAMPTREDPYHMAVPAVHRNAPCPCGSGRRYRECHRPRRTIVGRS